MKKLDELTIRTFCEKHSLTINECAKLIGISTQTLYNAMEGKSLKPHTLIKIQRWIQNQNRSHNEFCMDRNFENFTESLTTYTNLVQKEWQRKFIALTTEENQILSNNIKKLDDYFTQIKQVHHSISKSLSLTQ